MARAALNISVRHLAVSADVSPNTIARLERGEVLHRRTISHVRGVLEAQGVVFVSGGPRGAWPGSIVGYAAGRPLSGRARLFLSLWNLPSLQLEPAAAYGALLDIFEEYLNIIQAEGREPDTWERIDLNGAANYFQKSDVFSAYSCIRRGITPPDNQSPDYPICADDAASVVECDLAYFRKAVSYLRSKRYIERYPTGVAGNQTAAS
jgi:transcriptional regulator with XRE-family HTH domain